MKRNIIAAILAATMGVSSLTVGVTAVAAEENPVDLTDEVNLVMYVVSERPAGQDEIDENFNKLLKEKMNTTLTINWLSWSDYKNKYPLLFSSGEQFDMVYTSNWLNLVSYAQRGAFMNLDELWPTYAPINYSRSSDAAKQQATIDGHIYVVPTLLGTYNAFGPIYRTDIMEGTEWNGKMETFEDLESYCDIVKENNPEIEPLDISSYGSQWDDVWMYSHGYLSSKSGTDDFLFFDPKEENPKLVTYYEEESTPEFLEMMSRWNEKGFYSKSALSDTDTTKMQNGKAAVKTHNLDNYKDLYMRNPDWKIEYQNWRDTTMHLPYTQDSMAIPVTSENPERVLAFWDLLTTDRELYDAFFYGIEGTSYELNDEGQYTILNPDLYATNAMWAARTPEFEREQVGTPETYGEWKDKLEAEIAADNSAEKFSGFKIDTSSVETEYAACQNVMKQYWYPLELGYTDPMEGLAEYKEKMDAAGIEKVREVIQKQLDEYVRNLK